MGTRLNPFSGRNATHTPLPLQGEGRDGDGVVPPLQAFTPIPTLPLKGRELWSFRTKIGIKKICARIWSALRELSGDDAYDRYLAHHAACHAQLPVLTRKVFFQQQQQQQWEGIKRCC